MSASKREPKRRRALISIPGQLVAGVIWVYQSFVSPLMPRRCRFYPTCSQYAKEAVLRYGVVRGGLMGLRRVLRCHPWNPGGYDPVE